MKPPKALKRPQTFKNHGDTRLDEYAWLQDGKSKETRAYVEAENRFASRSMASTRKLQKQLYKEIRARITEDDMSVPVNDGPYQYYTRTEKGKQYAIHCRKPVRGGKEEVILDENELARGNAFFALGDFDISPDHMLLAYTTDTTGNEHFTLYIKDLSKHTLLQEAIPSVSGVTWAEDGEYLFYTKEVHPFPPRQVYRHRLGEKAEEDVLIFEEKEPQWYVSIEKSRSRKYIFISIGNFDTSEQWYLPAHTPLAKPRRIEKRKKHVKYSAGHWGDSFYIVTNDRAVNYKILQRRIDPETHILSPKVRTWMAHSPARAITALCTFKHFFAIALREKGSEWIYITTPRGSRRERIPLPEEAHSLSMWGNLEFDSPFVRFTYSSFVTPRTVYDYDIKTKETTLKKRQRVPGWDPRAYTSERIWVKNGDVRIPVSICYKKGTRRTPRPLLLNAYGSYGITNDPYFSVAQLSLLKRGWILATAHPRGGGEMGWSWHKAAYRLTKHRTYEDLLAVSDALVKQKYTTRDLLAVSGGSAGGMTWGAVLNMNPGIAKAAVIYVPNSDVVTSMLDTSLGGTILHYDELGDPRKKKEYHYLKRWSPYENIQSAEYPSLLVRASLHDIRTPFWEAAKWVARLRDRATFRGPALLKIETHAGHAGKSGRYEWIKEKAFDFAFLITTVAKARQER